MTQAQQIVTHEDTAQPVAHVAPSESSAIISMIERAARDPSVDIVKMERLFEMHERAENRRSAMAYAAALSLVQPLMPVVDRRGRITITDKNDRNKVIQSTPYALWEDINSAIRPILADHHFALSFRTGTTTEGKITVTAVLSHAEGHSEETTITLMHDSSGSKNSVQAVGSSISYGKRYTAGLLLNITSKGEDDDGKAAGEPDHVSDVQVAELQSLIVEAGADIPRFLKFMKIEKLADLPISQFERAKSKLEAKRTQS
jgi:ERF superfamily